MTPDEAAQAECLGEDPDLWSSRIDGEAGCDYEHRLAVARNICDNECPVKAACYATGLTLDRADGMWGGVMFVKGKVDGKFLNGASARPTRPQEAARFRGLGWSRVSIAERLEVTVETVDRMLQREAEAA